MTNIIQRLPVEIRTLLYLNLGIHDLRNLILAYPSLSNEVLIVKDAEPGSGLRSTLFSPYTNVEVCCLSQYLDPLGHYKRSRRFAITVFELVDEEHFIDDDNKFWTDGTHPLTDFVSQNSIIYVHLSMSEFRPSRFRGYSPDKSIISPFYGRNTLEFFKSVCPRVHVDPVEFSAPPPQSLYVVRSIGQSNLVDLSDADIAGRKANLNLPWATELTIRVLPANDSPTIENINAPRVHKFSLFYGRAFPRICNVKLGYRRQGLSQKPAFRLIHYDAYPAHVVTYPLPPCSRPHNFVNSVHSMGVKHFTEVHLIGGPDVLLQEVLHENLCTLYWKRTNYQNLNIWGHNMTLPLAQCQRLDALYFETTVPHTIMPALDLNVLSTLSIVSYDPWLDISPFANSFVDEHSPRLSTLLLHSYAPNVENAVPLIVPLNWVNTGTISRGGQPLWYMDLYGCVFPEEVSRERRPSEDNGVIFEWYSVRWRNMKGKYADLDNQPRTPLVVQILNSAPVRRAQHRQGPEHGEQPFGDDLADVVANVLWHNADQMLELLDE